MKKITKNHIEIIPDQTSNGNFSITLKAEKIEVNMNETNKQHYSEKVLIVQRQTGLTVSTSGMD